MDKITTIAIYVSKSSRKMKSSNGEYFDLHLSLQVSSNSPPPLMNHKNLFLLWTAN